ncbi:MAG: hypothetical protein Q9201_006852 [Fulgogasparrea decipioides]
MDPLFDFPSTPNVHHRELVMRMTSSLESGKYSDLTIKCRGREFHVHRVVLCTASKVFATACDGAFKEAQNGKIDLSEDDPGAIQRMLEYLYSADYDEMDHPHKEEKESSDEHQCSAVTQSPKPSPIKANDATSDEWAQTPRSLSRVTLGRLAELDGEFQGVIASAPLNNVLVYATADKYELQSLKKMSRGKFQSCCRYVWDGDDILTVLQLVYQTTPSADRGLCDIILEVYSNHRDQLMHNVRLPEIFENDATLAFDVFSRVKEDLDTRVSTLEKCYDDLSDSLQQAQKGSRKKRKHGPR